MKRFSFLKIFVVITICTSLIFLIASFIVSKTSENSFIENSTSKVDTANKIVDVSKISTDYLIKFFNEELPFFKTVVKSNEVDKGSILAMVSINPYDWVLDEVPYLSSTTDDELDDSQIIDDQDIVMELAPPDSFFLAEKNNIIANNSEENPKEDTKMIEGETSNQKAVFIYHTHNRESFLPELNTDEANKAYDKKINVTLVGEKLTNELKKLGIPTANSKKDYWPELEDYALSYKYSLQTVKAAIQQNGDYDYIFDIHRDASSRKKTTRKINGEDYAAIYIVIGEGNKRYKENKKLATKLHNTLEELYPGLSKGILSKEKTKYTNGVYNQSVSNNALTLEIGGVYNTLEEEYRTAEALAQVIASMYHDAKMVDAELRN